MIGLLPYLIVGLGVIGLLGGVAYKAHEAGADGVRLEWAAANAAAQKKAEEERARQDALRQAQDREATRRLANERERSRTLMASLEAHIKAAGAAARCPVPAGLFDAWNDANAGPEGKRPGTVPATGPAAAPAR